MTTPEDLENQVLREARAGEARRRKSYVRQRRQLCQPAETRAIFEVEVTFMDG
jgi:hypothetical protein